MSLKTFHLVFIAFAIMLAAFTAAWATTQYRAAHDAGSLATAAVCVLTGIALSVYAAKFQRKARRL